MSLEWIDNQEIIRKWLSVEELKELRKEIKRLRANQKETNSVDTVNKILST